MTKLGIASAIEKAQTKRAERCELTLKQERFVQEYLIEPNAAQAAIRAGYSAKTARVIGAQNLSKLNISAAIEKARTAHAVRAELNADMVIDELRKIAFANLADYVSRTAAGEPYLDFAALTRDQAAALAKVNVENFVDGHLSALRSTKAARLS